MRMLWHAPIGAVAAPFAPVFLGQTAVPEEFQLHRYLTVGESHRFIDNNVLIDREANAQSVVLQGVESIHLAVAICKRLLYLILQDADYYSAEVVDAFEGREAQLIMQTESILDMVEVLIKQGQEELSLSLLTYFSNTELRAGLDLVLALSASIEARIRIRGGPHHQRKPKTFDQIW